mgnify:CR=1 FL=1
MLLYLLEELRQMGAVDKGVVHINGQGHHQKASNLKGRLEIIIGGTDPTCVPQHTYTFLRACIEAGTHPDLFIYPGHKHNVLGRDRVHLHEKITRYFEDYL